MKVLRRVVLIQIIRLSKFGCAINKAHDVLRNIKILLDIIIISLTRNQNIFVVAIILLFAIKMKYFPKK